MWNGARDLARLCRASGRTVPAADVIVAACALSHGVPLDHCDAHIDNIMNLAKRGRKTPANKSPRLAASGRR